MATRSEIGILQEDGYSVRSVYCHFDGYLEGVGKTLATHYTERNKVEALIALGALSVLGAEVSPMEGEVHTFATSSPNVTVAYHRDRGDELVIDITSKRRMGGEFNYIFGLDDVWRYSTGGNWHIVPGQVENNSPFATINS